MSGILQKPPAVAVFMNWILRLAGNLRKTKILKSEKKIFGLSAITTPLSIAQTAEPMCLRSLAIAPIAGGSCNLTEVILRQRAFYKCMVLCLYRNL